MNTHNISKLALAVLGADVAHGRQQIDSVAASIQSIGVLQTMRENADLVRRIYNEYPSLDGVTLNFYFCGPDEMDFYLTDVVSEGDDDDELGAILQDVLSDFSEDCSVAGALNTDGDMLKFNDVLTKEEKGVRILETTRTQVDAAMKDGDINALAYALFPDSWNKHKDQVLSKESQSSSDCLSIFAQTTQGAYAWIEINRRWLDRVQSMTQLACENEVNVTVPTHIEFSDSDLRASGHEAVIVPGPQWSSDQAGVQFSAFEDDESDVTVLTPVIELSHLRKAINAGDREFTVDFDGAEVCLDEVMDRFGLIRDANGELVKDESVSRPRERGI